MVSSTTGETSSSFSVTSSVTISDTGSMSTRSSFFVGFCKERHKDINVSLSLKSLLKMPSILLQVGLVDFQMGKLLHFGNVAPFSLDTTHIIPPDDKICKHGRVMRKPVL